MSEKTKEQPMPTCVLPTEALNAAQRKHAGYEHLTIAQARVGFSDVVGRSLYASQRTVLTRHGRDVAAVVPMRDVELLERLENYLTLRDSVASLERSREEGVRPLTDILAELGLT